MSSHVVVRALPFATHLRIGSGKELVARDKARAQKLLAGVRPHGPLAFHEERRKREHERREHHDRHEHREHRHEHAGSTARHHHGHGGDSTGTDTGSTGTGASTGGSATAPSTDGVGVDVTDAGVTYTANVAIGSPATDYTLLIDTGKSTDHSPTYGVMTPSPLARFFQHLGWCGQTVRQDEHE